MSRPRQVVLASLFLDVSHWLSVLLWSIGDLPVRLAVGLFSGSFIALQRNGLAGQFLGNQRLYTTDFQLRFANFVLDGRLDFCVGQAAFPESGKSTFSIRPGPVRDRGIPVVARSLECGQDLRPGPSNC